MMTLRIIAVLHLAALYTVGQSQIGRVTSVHVSGRIVDSIGIPMRVSLPMVRLAPEGAMDEGSLTVDSAGRFTFLVRSDRRYRTYMSGYGVRNRKTIDITGGKDIEVGDLVFKRCPDVSFTAPRAPTPIELNGGLRPGQIMIEPQSQAKERWSTIDLPLAPKAAPNGTIELPQCWSVPTLDNREEWEDYCQLSFDRYISIESFVGGEVKFIRVVGYVSSLAPLQIQDEVLKVWLGKFQNADCTIGWAEYTTWNIKATVEFEDGTRSSILTDGGVHAVVQDRNGKYWYLRLRPAR